MLKLNRRIVLYISLIIAFIVVLHKVRFKYNDIGEISLPRIILSSLTTVYQNESYGLDNTLKNKPITLSPTYIKKSTPSRSVAHQIEKFERKVFSIGNECVNETNLTIPYFRARDKDIENQRIIIKLQPKLSCNNDTDIFMFVMTHPRNVYERSQIRKHVSTFMQEFPQRLVFNSIFKDKHKVDIRLVFIFGKTYDSELNNVIANESKIYDDVIQSDFLESYHNLTYKTRTAFKWISENCPQAKYILKADDDILVNLSRVLHIIDGTPDMTRNLIGQCIKGVGPMRASASPKKWIVPCNEYPYAQNPSYLKGPSYIISVDSVHDIYSISNKVPVMRIDDVYITGIVRLIANITLKCVKEFTLPLA